MKFYFINADVEHVDGAPYVARLSDAQRAARAVTAVTNRDCEVEHVEVGTDRTAILNLLNVGPGAHRSLGVVYTAKAKGRTA